MSVVPQSLPKWCRAANAALCHLRPSLRRKKTERLYAVSYEPHNICGHGVDIGALSLVVLYCKSHAV
jgi:hypothetical protein